jgi:hypothetical protein
LSMVLAGRGGMGGIFFPPRVAVHSVPGAGQHCMTSYFA